MKQLFFLLGILLFASCASHHKKEVTKQKETFKVYGNCGMCKTIIEASLADVTSVYWSDWDIETKEITVKFNSNLITLEQIKEYIAAVGYDSNTHRAENEVYENLHGCCKYERPE